MEDWSVLLGPFGLTAGAVLVAAYLGRLHAKEDAAREKRLEATEAREDVLVKAVADSTELFKDLRDELKQLRAQEQERLIRDEHYHGPERRGTSQ